ncbi:hypothetical protein ACHWQZ_G010825 [Mnemiopsis leidyi]
MALVSVVTALKLPSGRQGFDADTLREVTQKSLNSINAWCKKSGLKLSHLKSHCVMFTNRKSWSFDQPLKVDGAEINVLNSTKFLGLTLDSKLNWNEHIDNLCKKTKCILMQCRRAVGPTWGFKPATMRWVYNAMVKPVLSYWSTIWINGTKTKRNQTLLNGVQRLANVIITGALPTTPGTALDVITGTPPLDLWLSEEAAKGALRLRDLGHWLPPPAGRPSTRLTSHISTNDRLLRDIPECNIIREERTPALSIDQTFQVEIPTKETYQEADYEQANNVLLRWIPAHKGHEGNETADRLAKNGANNCDEPELVKLPIPCGVCYAALRRKTLSDWCRTFAVCPPKVFYTMWRDRFSRGLLKMGKRDLRVATQILTGYTELNYHLRKLNRDIAPTCSLCQEENETVEHVLTRCPLLWELRVELFDSHVTTISAILERFDITQLVKFMIRSGTLKSPDMIND